MILDWEHLRGKFAEVESGHGLQAADQFAPPSAAGRVGQVIAQPAHGGTGRRPGVVQRIPHGTWLPVGLIVTGIVPARVGGQEKDWRRVESENRFGRQVHVDEEPPVRRAGFVERLDVRAVGRHHIRRRITDPCPGIDRVAFLPATLARTGQLRR